MQAKFEPQPTCPVCDSEPTATAKRVQRMHLMLPQHYTHCDNCGVFWQSPRLADDFIDEYYRDIYRQITSPNLAARTRTIEVCRMRAAIQVDWLAQFTGKHKTALDFGCSAGVLLDHLKAIGLNVVGVESGENEFTALAKERHEVRATIDEYEQSFDVITMSHVLEHINHPLGFLKMIADKLNPGGLLFVDVPNYRADPNALLLHHPVAYDADSLARLLGSAGFEVIKHTFYDWDNTPMDKNLIMAATKARRRSTKNARN